jgi:hypothetical protein
MALMMDRTRVIAMVSLVIVIGTSIALRKVVPYQTTRMAIGIVELILIATLVRGIVRPR